MKRTYQMPSVIMTQLTAKMVLLDATLGGVPINTNPIPGEGGGD